MDARLERKLRMAAIIVASSVVSAIGFVLALGYHSPAAFVVGISYALILSATIAGVSLFIIEGPMRDWLADLPFLANLLVRSAIYGAIILPVLILNVGEWVAGINPDATASHFWIVLIYCAVIVLLANLAFGIANIIGPRALLSVISGRYHRPVEENRFVLFVDIAGSTGLAERLGGVRIHRLLDQIFRLLTLAVVDYRGEVLNYVGDEVIVTWPERRGAIDGRPLRCFLAMRQELARAADQIKREFGVVPLIRGSLHFGPVIIGEIGDVKRAIVFNGDVMNTAARLEQLSRHVEGGFLASRAAMEKFTPAPPVAIRALGLVPIRGRADGIDVFGIEAALTPAA